MGKGTKIRRKINKRFFGKAILIPFLFSGCVVKKDPHVGYIEYDGKTCYTTGQDISLINNNGDISCENDTKGAQRYKIVYKERIVKKEKIRNIRANQRNGCETEITEKFYSNASGWITICKGKLLSDGQVSRVVVVKK